MAERKDTPFTGEHFSAWCEKMVGQPYWYGSCVYKCSQSLLDRKAKQYPAHYTSSRMKRYKDDISKKNVCADCVGGCKGYAWTNGGVGVLESVAMLAKMLDKGLIDEADYLALETEYAAKFLPLFRYEKPCFSSTLLIRQTGEGSGFAATNAEDSRQAPQACTQRSARRFDGRKEGRVIQ